MISTLLKKYIIQFINLTHTSSIYLGSPKKMATTEAWCEKNSNVDGVTYKRIHAEKQVTENHPLALDCNFPSLYSNEFIRQQNSSFVATIPNARVWGRYGAVITLDDCLLCDVSREFGQYGGVFGKEHSIFKQIKLIKLRKLKGVIAVIACAGSSNYHHWLYDVLPRIHLLKIAGSFDDIDKFIIDYSGLNFQQESLSLLGIPLNKIIISNNNWKFHIQAQVLIVPSLPSRLGTMSDWVIEFLRNTFLSNTHILPEKKLKIYLSRRKAATRKLVNEEIIFKNLALNGYEEFFAEDFTIKETAKVFANCSNILGVHGSGFANLAFCSPETIIVDILAPKHFDAYYWMLSNNRKLKYAYIFGRGKQLPNGTDLVKNKVDEDIELDFSQLTNLLDIL